MKDSSALRFIAGLLKVLAALTAIFFILAIIFGLASSNSYLNSSFAPFAIVILIAIGALATIIQLAFAEIILLFLQIEINTRPKQINNQSKEAQWECNHCGFKQSNKFDFCPKCGLDDYGLTEKESRKNRLKREVEDENYREKIREILEKRQTDDI
ncbi:MAG TPA: hypothetical protein VIK55_08345 [Paludibacter sp.]